MKPLGFSAALYACLLSFTSASAVAQTAAAPAASFAIHDGDHVLFYGDSITEQRLYTTFVEEYVLTRFPAWKVQFTEAGIGGDKVSGGWAGPIDLRLQRDVVPEKPTVMTIMLGMNDGYYRPPSAPIQTTYQNGYRYLVDTTLAALPGVRLWLLGPSPYDDTTQPTMHYNEVMQAFSRFDQSEAERTHQHYADLNAPVVDVLQQVKSTNPALASDLIPDRVHPGGGVHWVMAEAVLKAWHAPALVSTTAIDARAGRSTDVQNVTVSGVKREKDGSLAWTSVESALPLPVPLAAADQLVDLAFQASGFEAALDEEVLTVTGLGSGTYLLSIDGHPIESFAADALEHGVNLARLLTPMLSQSLMLAWNVDHRNEMERQLARLTIGTSQDSKAAPEAEQQALQHAIATSIAELEKEAQPKPHHFALTRASAAK